MKESYFKITSKKRVVHSRQSLTIEEALIPCVHYLKHQISEPEVNLSGNMQSSKVHLDFQN